MDNLRLIVYLSFGFVALMLWQSWLVFQNPPPPAADSAPAAQSPAPPAETAADSDVPAAGVQPSSASPQTPAQKDRPIAVAADSIRAQTDVLSLSISTRGGDIQSLDLLQIPVSSDDGAEPLRLLKNEDEGDVYIAQSGLLHDRLPDASDTSELAPSHHAVYEVSRTDYTLADGDDILRVPLHWSNGEAEVEKVYVFRRGSYLIEVEHHINNRSGKSWIGRQYVQLRRTEAADNDGNQFIYTFTGATYYDGSYHKVSFEDIAEQPLSQSILGGWAAMIEHYFVSALVPLSDQTQDYYTKAVTGDRHTAYIIGARSEPLTVSADTAGTFKTRLYAGPKLQQELKQIAPGLELTVDYGIFTALSKPLFWLLEKIYNLFGNWGWSIVIVTLLIKLVFYKLSEASYRSMAKMRKFQPQIMALRERYSEDRQRMNQEMMDLYKKEKVNPLGGCLPILVQIPVFIALYWVLIESVELRHAPFIGWITDLSAKDPFFVLPLLMGVTMFIQNRLNPTPPDPLQAKVMMMLPVIFTFFFAFFPAGLVLYWFVNNLLSIAQQWVITRRIERAD